MFFRLNKLALITFAVGTGFFLACSGDKKDTRGKSDNGNINENLQQKNIQEYANQVKTIFYNIPSPVEMAELTQKANLTYNSDILNSLDKIDQYTSTKSMALNLGVYGADLSYTRLYDQIQESINYLSAIRKLSEELGVPQEEGAFALSRLEENINNRDSLLFIITDLYANADLYLKENERSGTAALIITGGWIEALYISTNILDDDNPNPEIMERIAEQKFSVDNLIALLKKHYKENESLSDIFSLFDQLKQSYDKIELIYKPGKVITDEEIRLTSINSKTQVYVNFDQIKEIREINNKLRALIIS